jgi:hypothetical protein
MFCRYIQSTCATSGEGLYEGLDWLSNNIASKVCAIISVFFIASIVYKVSLSANCGLSVIFSDSLFFFEITGLMDWS